jgi:hypothetical protein
MPKPVLKKKARPTEHIARALAETERVLMEAQRAALDRLRCRGVLDRDELARWLVPPRGACWRVSSIVERDEDFVVTITLPGVDSRLAEVTREPRRLVIRSPQVSHASHHEHLALDLPVDLDSDRLAAYLQDGCLVIVAPKA